MRAHCWPGVGLWNVPFSIVFVFLIFHLSPKGAGSGSHPLVLCLQLDNLKSNNHHHHHHNNHNQPAVQRASNRSTTTTTSGSSSTSDGTHSEHQQQHQQPFDRDDYQQDQPATPPILDQCCACDEAKYELVFEGLWSKYTHPEDFPENYWLAHFSDIIGASHSNEFRMWSQDAFATEGVRELAESGATKKLESELKQVSSKTRTIIKARELRYPTLNSKTSAVFRTDRQHHLVSILSKLGPSPDWMVGVSGLELCQADCSWVAQRVVPLNLWDAGTDSGISFTSPDSPSNPQERIRPYRKVVAAAARNQQQQQHQMSAATSRSSVNQQFAGDITIEQPGGQSDQLGPQENGAEDESATGQQINSNNNNSNNNQQQLLMSHEQMKPFARLTITRQRIYEKSCNGGGGGASSLSLNEPINRLYNSGSQFATIHNTSSNNNNNSNNNQQLELTTESTNYASQPADSFQCEVTEWSQWSECSVACGRGTKIRTRQYVRKEDSDRCQTKLIQKQACNGRPELCKQVFKGSQTVASTQPNQQQHQQQRRIVSNPDLPVIDCKLSNWSPWSTCSALCGNGRRSRSRYIIQMPQNGGKPCDKKLARWQRCKDLPKCPPDFGSYESSLNGQPTGSKSSSTNNARNLGPGMQKDHHHHHQQHRTAASAASTTTTTTTTAGSSMMDDEDDSKFSRLLKAESGILQLASFNQPTESYIADGIGGPSAYASSFASAAPDSSSPAEMELIGSSSFRIRNGYVYSDALNNINSYNYNNNNNLSSYMIY